MKRLSILVICKARVMSFVLLCLFFVFSFLCVSVSGAQTVYFGKANKKVPIYGVQRQDKKVALTFDAAWGADKTRAIVDILIEKKCGGTFFLVGFWVEKYPDEVRYIDENNLEIGTHSATHPHLPRLDGSKIYTELQSSVDRIFDITQKPVKFFRPPFGDYNDVLINVAEKLQLKTIQWSIDSLDWKDTLPEKMLSKIAKNLQPSGGDIILFHNNSKYILQTLPKLLDNLLANGYQVVPLSEVVYEDGYSINSEGIQIKT